jgi:hypothetical protein
MKLSDTQYKLLTRIGLVLAVVAALCYDKVGVGYRPAFIAVAVVAGVVGFFPLVTSHAFEASEDSEVTTFTQPISEPVQLFTPAPVDETVLSDRSLERYVQHLFSTVRSEFQRQDSYPSIYSLSNYSLSNVAYARYTSGNLQKGRSERVREMCEVVSNLGTMPQEFSVELTSEGSIIVHCLPQREVYDTESAVTEKWPRQRETPTQETVH